MNPDYFFVGVANPPGIREDGYDGYFYTDADVRRAKLSGKPIRVGHDLGDLGVGQVEKEWVSKTTGKLHILGRLHTSAAGEKGVRARMMRDKILSGEMPGLSLDTPSFENNRTYSVVKAQPISISIVSRPDREGCYITPTRLDGTAAGEYKQLAREIIQTIRTKMSSTTDQQQTQAQAQAKAPEAETSSAPATPAEPAKAESAKGKEPAAQTDSRKLEDMTADEIQQALVGQIAALDEENKTMKRKYEEENTTAEKRLKTLEAELERFKKEAEALKSQKRKEDEAKVASVLEGLIAQYAKSQNIEKVEDVRPAFEQARDFLIGNETFQRAIACQGVIVSEHGKLQEERQQLASELEKQRQLNKQQLAVITRLGGPKQIAVPAAVPVPEPVAQAPIPAAPIATPAPVQVQVSAPAPAQAQAPVSVWEQLRQQYTSGQPATGSRQTMEEMRKLRERAAAREAELFPPLPQ